MAIEANEEQQTYAIGAVARLTGLSEHTIRIWERRYGAVVAHRAPNGRRVYTPQDVEKLSFLKILTERGVAIGGIAAESLDQLRQRARSLGELAAPAAPSQINTAILGELLPWNVKSSGEEIAPLHIVVGASNEESFLADLAQQPVDVLVLELPFIAENTVDKIRSMRTASGAQRAVVAYTFGKTIDVERVKASGAVVLRAPVSVDELKAAVVRAYSASGKPRPKRKPGAVEPSSLEWDLDAPVEPRRFSQEQLAALANVSSTIDCECPKHLAQLVSDLSAFEVYSANCANRNAEDAALHHYLHRATAQARSLIEAALERVAEAEGLLK